MEVAVGRIGPREVAALNEKLRLLTRSQLFTRSRPTLTPPDTCNPCGRRAAALKSKPSYTSWMWTPATESVVIRLLGVVATLMSYRPLSVPPLFGSRGSTGIGTL